MVVSILKFILVVIALIEFLLFTLLMYLLTFIPGIEGSKAYFRAFRFWCRSFVRALGVQIKVHQKNINTLPEHYVMIANHPSAFEDIGIPAAYPVHSLAKIEVKDWLIVGPINRCAGTLYVDRNSKESRSQAVDMMLERANKGINIALYPEGGCTGRRITKDFKHGAFELSMRSGLPIVPVFLHYESQQDFEWQPPFSLIDMLWHFRTSQNQTANIYQFDAIHPQDFENIDSYIAHVRQLYMQWQLKYLE